MNLTLITSALAAALGFGAAWTWQGRAIDSLKLEAKDAVIVQQRNARAALERSTNQVIAAQNQAAARAVVLRSDAGRAANAGSGLRIASTDVVRAAASDTDACTAALAAHGVILTESISFIRELASDADQWASHAVMLQDGWPR